MHGDPWPVAMAAFRRGQLGEAGARCERMLARNASDAGGWQLLGLAALQARDPSLAVAALQHSLRLQANQPATLVNLGVALRSLGRYREALNCYDQALSLQPALPEALSNRANALVGLQKYAEAVESCDRALTARPGYAEAFNNKGNALQALGQPQEALACFEAALRFMPRLASAHNNRAVAFLAIKRPADALAACDCALDIDQSYADAHNNRGIALKELGRLADALSSYDRALLLQPDLARAHANRSGLLSALGRVDEALSSIDRALTLAPDNPSFLCIRAAALRRLGRHLEALSTFELALRADAGWTLALQGRAEVLADLSRYEEAISSLVNLLHRVPDSDFAPGHLMHCRLNVCDWTGYESRLSQLLTVIARGERAVAPFWCLALSDSAAVQLQCARIFATRHGRGDPLQRPARPHRHDKIRIGYLSADFRDHPISRLMIGVWEQHDRKRFEICAISLNSREGGALSRRLHAAFDRFEDASKLSDDDLAALIRRLEVDVLVDLIGFTTGMRPGVLARRAAPVQVNYLGYPGTAGSSDADYIIGDAFVIPAGAESFYSEHVVRLPVCFQANDDQRPTAERAPTRAEVGLPPDATVLSSFNNVNRLTPAMFNVWMHLLQACRHAVLWIATDQATARENLRSQAHSAGIAPDRLVFAPRKPYGQHLARLALADLHLDTFPFNGGSTASDALYAGVPVLTCCGEAFASRMAGSLLHALGLPELIAGSLEEYETIGRELLGKPARLAVLRSAIAQSQARNAVFDSRRFCRDLESAYVLMWGRQQRDELPADITVVR